MQQSEFLTSDYFTAAAVSILLDILPTYRPSGSKTLAVFPASPAVYQAVNDFNSGVSLNAMEFTAMVKTIRAEMISRRRPGAPR